MAETAYIREASLNSVVHLYALAAPGSATNMVTPFTPSAHCSALRVTVSLATGSVFNVRVTNGTTAYTQSLNGGTALTAGCLYTFTFAVRATTSATSSTALTYSFQVATDSVIQTLFVDECVGPVL